MEINNIRITHIVKYLTLIFSQAMLCPSTLPNGFEKRRVDILATVGIIRPLFFRKPLFGRSSMVERLAVNQNVTGSSPVARAKQ